MIKITNPKGWQGVDKILTSFEQELRKNLGQSVIVWPFPSTSIAMRTMAVVKKDRRHNHGYLLKITVGLEEIGIEYGDLHSHTLPAEFAQRTLPVVLKTVTELLANHN